MKLLFLSSLLVAAAFAQPALQFEVASVKVHTGPLSAIWDFSSSGARATWIAYPARGLVMEAYNLKSDQVTAATPVAEDDNTYYDIVAEAPGNGTRTRAEFREMLKVLLKDRFQLDIRHEMKAMPVYALVVGKHGASLKESASDAVWQGHIGLHGRNYVLTGTGYRIEDLADALGNVFCVGLPVVDRTGLAGRYEVRLEATPECQMRRDAELSDLSVFSALEEQLGLRLESQRGQREIVTIVRFEKPTPN